MSGADNPPILIATERGDDSELIARVLSEEFARVHVSTDPMRCVQDFELHKPAVLILAFNTLDKAKRYFLALRQPSLLVQALPHRVLILCGPHDTREVYELCKESYFDDFVLFWPKTEDMRPLRMSVRRALGQAIGARAGAPSASDFAARVRPLAVLETLLEGRAAKAPGVPQDGPATLLEPLRALRLLAERCQPLVLVVDDDKLQHKLLARVLALEGVELAFATSAADAIASLHRRRPDLILMDISMPDVDGIEATRLLKSAAQFAAIAVIMVTGVGGQSVVVESLRAGAADFVVKPFDRNILLAKVRKLLFGRTSAV